MPPQILLAIGAITLPLLAILGVIYNLRGVLAELAKANLRDADLARLAKATRGLANVLITVAPLTPTDLDDAAAKVLDGLADELEPLVKKYPAAARNMSRDAVINKSKGL